MRTIESADRQRFADPLSDLNDWVRKTRPDTPVAVVGPTVIDGTEHLWPLPKDPEAGMKTVDALVDQGCRLIVFASDTDASVPVRALVALLTHRDAGRVAREYQPGVDSAEAWRKETHEIAEAIYTHRDALNDVDRVAERMGCNEIAAVAAMIVAAASRKTPVLLQGSGAHAGALLAHRWAHRSNTWLATTYPESDPVIAVIQERLQLTPVIASPVTDDLRTRTLPLALAHVLTLVEVSRD